MNLLQQAAHQPVRPEEKPKRKPPSALEAFGNLLSLPGSSVLDVATWKNPSDQWVDPFGNNADTNRTTGRQALRDYGLAGADDTWANAAAGFAVDVATDPLSYAGLGVLTRGGKIASKAGLIRKGSGVADTLTDRTTKSVRQLLEQSDDYDAASRAWKHAGGTDDLLDSKLQSLVKFKVPGLKELNLNAKPVAQAIDKVAAKALELPGARRLRAAFSPSVLNTVTQAGQDIAEHRKLAVDDAISDIGARFAPIIKSGDLTSAKPILDDVERELAASGIELGRLGDNLSPPEISSALSRAEHLTRAAGMAHAATELLGTSAKLDGTGVPLSEALKRLGMDTPQARSNLQDWLRESLDSYTIANDLLDDAGRFVRPFTDPETVGAARKAIETFNRLFKSHVTMPFPAFHTRNLFSAQLQNVLFGASDPTVKGPLAYAKPIAQAYKLRNGKTLKNLSKDIPEFRDLGLTDREATDALSNEVFARRLIGDSQNAADVGKFSPDAATRMPGVPRERNPILQKGAFNPLNVENFIPTRLGGDVASFVEELNRLAPYIAYRKQGYTADAAAELVKKIQVDYSNATHWEQKYGRNIIPFWMFSSRMLPLVAEELATRPGGAMAQTIKAAGRGSQDNPPPRWMAGQTTIPVGNGHLAGLGLAHDGAASILASLARGDFKELSKDIGGRLNPLLKFPVELATGQSIYHGRPHSTLPPDVAAIMHNLSGAEGRPQPFVNAENEHMLRNTPLARYLSTLRRLSDTNRSATDRVTSFGTGLTYSQQRLSPLYPKL